MINDNKEVSPFGGGVENKSRRQLLLSGTRMAGLPMIAPTVAALGALGFQSKGNAAEYQSHKTVKKELTEQQAKTLIEQLKAMKTVDGFTDNFDLANCSKFGVRYKYSKDKKSMRGFVYATKSNQRREIIHYFTINLTPVETQPVTNPGVMENDFLSGELTSPMLPPTYDIRIQTIPPVTPQNDELRRKLIGFPSPPNLQFVLDYISGIKEQGVYSPYRVTEQTLGMTAFGFLYVTYTIVRRADSVIMQYITVWRVFNAGVWQTFATLDDDAYRAIAGPSNSFAAGIALAAAGIVVTTIGAYQQLYSYGAGWFSYSTSTSKETNDTEDVVYSVSMAITVVVLGTVTGGLIGLSLILGRSRMTEGMKGFIGNYRRNTWTYNMAGNVYTDATRAIFTSFNHVKQVALHTLYPNVFPIPVVDPAVNLNDLTVRHRRR